MGTKWTNEQQSAIDTTGKSVYVSAAAGSGKTAVLSERVLKLVLDGNSIDKFLIVTFTVAAAGEMKMRILDKLNNYLKDNPDNEYILKQSLLVNKARISTISSFCYDIVKQNFSALDLSPDFQIADTATLNLLELAVCDSVIEEAYEKNDDALSYAIDCFCGEKNDVYLTDMVLQISRALNCQVDREKWLEEICNMFAGDLSEKDNATISFFNKFFINSINSFIKNYEFVVNALSQIEQLNANYIIAQNELQLIKEAKALLYSSDLISFCNLLIDFVFEKKVTPKGFGQSFENNAFDQARKQLKDFISKHIVVFKDNYISLINDNERIYPAICALVCLVKEFCEKLDEEKKRRRIVSFSDIEHYAFKLLIKDYDYKTGEFTKTQLARNLTSQFDFVMVDEYQDTNNLQDVIFSAISDNQNNMFLVGDIKQSIYKFRNSNPKIFSDRIISAKKAQNENASLISLFSNFRSQKNILDFTNFIFSAVMSMDAGDVDYDDTQRLNYGASMQLNNQVDYDIIKLEKDSGEDETDSQDNYDSDSDSQYIDSSKEAVCARYIGSKIKDMILSGFKIEEGGVQRQAVYSDFAVLIHSPKNKIKTYIKEFEKMKIPLYSDVSEPYFEAYEVTMAISMLAAIDNPYRDVTLVSLMKSPVYLFTSDELAKIKLDYKKTSFFEHVLSAAGNGNEKCAQLVDDLEKYRYYSQHMPVYKLVWKIYSDKNLLSLVGGMKNGIKRVQNLRELYKQAQSFENSSLKGLHNFIRFIQQAMDSQNDIDGAVNMPEKNCVTISSIHKSKGLEYNICFLAHCECNFNYEDTRKELLIHPKLGLGPYIKDNALGVKYTTMQREAISLIMKNEIAAEELRVLYVALTRAKQKLVLVSALSEKEINQQAEKSNFCFDENDKVYSEFVLSRRSFSSLLLPVVSRLGNIGELEKYISVQGKSIYSPAEVNFNIVDEDSISYDYREICEEISDTSKEPDADICEIEAAIKYIYPYTRLTKIPAKLSVSEFKGRAIEETQDCEQLYKNKPYIKTPDFISKKGASAADRGNAIHHFMQFCNFDNIEKYGIADEIKRLCDEKYISDKQAELIDTKKLESFFASNIFSKIKASKQVHREYRFNIPISVVDYDSTAVEFKDEKILLQGIVDCFFIDDKGNLTILDYKTDKVENTNILVDKYKIQLKLYAKAIEMLYGVEANELVIYSFDKNCTVTIDK